MKKQLSIIVALSVFSAGSVHASDVSIRATDSQKVDADVSGMFKRSGGTNHSKGKKKQKTWSEGHDTSTGKSDKESVSVSKSANAATSVNLADMLSTKIAKLEATGVEPFASCQLYSRPRMPADFGLSAEVGRRGSDTNDIDPGKADFLSKAVASSMLIKKVGGDEELIQQFGVCAAQYGAYIAQSFQYFGSDLKVLKASVKRDKNNHLVINGLGYEDGVKLVEAAFDDAIKTGPQGNILKQMNAAISDKRPCKLAGSLELYICGGNKVGVGAQPTMMRNNVAFYGITVTGAGPLYGFTANYQISTGYSYQSALENMKSSSVFGKFAEDVSRYADDAESRGLTREATLAKKKAVELANSADASMSAQALSSAGQSLAH